MGQISQPSQVAANGTFNLTPSTTSLFQAARGRVTSGTANGKILCCGNSITAGSFATGNAMLNNASTKSYPTQLAQILSSQGLVSSWQSWIGGNGEANFNANDSRLTLGSWVNSGLGTLANNPMNRTAVGGTPMSFTPLTAVDTVQCLLVRAGGGVNVEISNDANPPAAVISATPGTGTMNISAPITLTGAASIKVINATLQVGSNSAFLDGMIAWNSAIKEMSILRAGWVGAIVNDLNQTWSYNNGIQTVAADLVLMAFTRNDITAGTPLATFTSLYQQAITAAKVAGDCILVIEPLGTVTAAQYTPYRNAVYQLAQANNCGVIDFTMLWAPYALTTAWYADGIHPNGFGYAEMARDIARILMNL
jgi:GDSL-like Lipase/Acylhydrolase family